MSNEIYHRWFICPAVEAEPPDEDAPSSYGSLVPKYTDTDGIVGYSGQYVPPEIAENHHAGFVVQFPDVDPWCIVKMYGTWDALNEIHAFYHDTDTLSDHGQDVAPVLNELLDQDRTGEEWDAMFYIGVETVD